MCLCTSVGSAKSQAPHNHFTRSATVASPEARGITLIKLCSPFCQFDNSSTTTSRVFFLPSARTRKASDLPILLHLRHDSASSSPPQVVFSGFS